ncbi:MAG: diaminopimelate dehydrogenase [Defluviitaleaceae bacterium]|nr:diaminopimelate dehydrogenase [Defluviitaleaceae bacterium]
MKKIRVAIVGLGNIGSYAIKAIRQSKDMELGGIVRRKVASGNSYEEICLVENIESLNNINVAILTTPSVDVIGIAEKYLKMGINTVDSFDIHNNIWDNKQRLDSIAKASGAVAVTSTGFDPGIDSIIRALFLAAAPVGITYTNYGPGISMGHTVAVKKISGVRNALSVTIPADGTGMHNRVVYLDIDDDVDFEAVSAKVKADPYFVNDNTAIIHAPDIEGLTDHGHGVRLVRKGVSSGAHNQRFEFNMSINNPAMTAQFMVAAARASVRLTAGCYTPIDIPPSYFLTGENEKLIRELV